MLKPKPIKKPIVKKFKPKTSLKTKLKIAAATGVIGASLLTGSFTKNTVSNLSKNTNAKIVNVYHTTQPAYPKGREKAINIEVINRNKKSNPNEIHFWDTKTQKINKINLDPVKMGNVFKLCYDTHVIEIEKVLREAGGQVWEKHFIEKPIKEVYKDLTPSQVQRIDNIVKTIPGETLQFIERESKLTANVLGVTVGAATGLLLFNYLAKTKLFKKRKSANKRK